MSTFHYVNPADNPNVSGYYAGTLMTNSIQWMKINAPQSGMLQSITLYVYSQDDGDGTAGPFSVSIATMDPSSENAATTLGTTPQGYKMPVQWGKTVTIPIVGTNGNAYPHIDAGTQYIINLAYHPNNWGILALGYYAWYNPPNAVPWNTMNTTYPYRCNAPVSTQNFSYGGWTVLFPYLDLQIYRDGSVAGGWSDWSAWSDCTAACAGGTQTATRTCTNPAPVLDGTCTGPSTKSQTCNTQPCPIDGGWTDWSWGTCSTTCGPGVQVGTRTCTNPTPQYGGQQCQGDSQTTQACNPGPCPINGGWSDWTDWSQCSVGCGSGTQTATRTCTNPSPQYGGANCQGDSSQTRTCNTDPCPVDGVWSDWGPWAACSADCGGGLQLRTRTCTPPQNGGQYCQGSDTDVQSCNNDPCVQPSPPSQPATPIPPTTSTTPATVPTVQPVSTAAIITPANVSANVSTNVSTNASATITAPATTSVIPTTTTASATNTIDGLPEWLIAIMVLLFIVVVILGMYTSLATPNASSIAVKS